MEKGLRTSVAGDFALPDHPARVHLMGICGTGMGALAGMFHEIGRQVTGSDQGIYPPMSDFMRTLGIRVKDGYRASNLDSRPDLVVVGNVIRRTNPEAVALEASNIPFTTMPGALNRYFAGSRTRIVVTGTHGKTTVSSMIAWILYSAGLDPGFLIGGFPSNFGKNYRLGEGDYFVIEGDEYDTAYFEKTPKFLHYSPHIGVITSCEFDHGDIYDSLDTIKEQFRAFAAAIPPDGLLVANTDDVLVAELVSGVCPSLAGYGMSNSRDWSVAAVRQSSSGIETVIRRRGIEVASGDLPVVGLHNLLNAVAAIAVSARVGIDPQKALSALGRFRGVRRRQEVIGETAGITLIDDFAHHPTAVRVTCQGLRSRYPGRRLVAVFEPRTNTSRRSIFQQDYGKAFLCADVVVLREPRNVDSIPVSDRFSSAKLADGLRAAGKKAYAFNDTDGIAEFLGESLKPGDVVVIMSNGSFDGLGARVLGAMGEMDHERSSSVRSIG